MSVRPAGPPPPVPVKGGGKGAAKGGKGPRPPPPAVLLPGRRPAEVFTGPKLRPLFWTAVAKVADESLWSDMVAPAPFDQAQLERQFAMAEPRTPSARRGAAEAGGGAVNESRKRIRVLDDRTSQLLAIAFNRLPPPERLAAVVDSLEGFPEELPAEAVLALNSAVSEQREAVEQLRQLKVGGADITQLDMPERYLWVLSSVPCCAAKLACGALIVGQAREIEELQREGNIISVCCQAIRTSSLVKKCVSTSLAVGNFMNRGTARCGVQAIVLPDSLVKLDELRGRPLAGEDAAAGESRGPSLLDFVAQAIVDESRGSQDLLVQVQKLRGKVRAAQSVCLQDAAANCQRVNSEASRVWKSLGEMQPTTPAVGRLTEKIRLICEQATAATKALADAKAELEKTQTWSSAKGNVKSEDWFREWGNVLDLLNEALGRARPPTPRPATAPCTSMADMGHNVLLMDILGRSEYAASNPPERGTSAERRPAPLSAAMRTDTGSLTPSSPAARNAQAAPPAASAPTLAVSSTGIARQASATEVVAVVPQPQQHVPAPVASARIPARPLFDEDVRIEDLLKQVASGNMPLPPATPAGIMSQPTPTCPPGTSMASAPGALAPIQRQQPVAATGASCRQPLLQRAQSDNCSSVGSEKVGAIKTAAPEPRRPSLFDICSEKENSRR